MAVRMRLCSLVPGGADAAAATGGDIAYAKKSNTMENLYPKFTEQAVMTTQLPMLHISKGKSGAPAISLRYLEWFSGA